MEERKEIFKNNAEKDEKGKDQPGGVRTEKKGLQNMM